MTDVILKKGKEKSLLRRHPWVYDTAVAEVHGQPGPGSTVRVLSSSGQVLGQGAWSPGSSLRVRMWGFGEEFSAAGSGFLRARIHEAVTARDALLARTSARRVVFGEADGIPGLIADAYGQWVVTQFQSAGAELHREEIAAALISETGACGIYDRSDAATRAREGLQPRTGVLLGEEPPEFIEITEDGVRYFVDVRAGHKTGFYIDQRESRLAAQELAAGFRIRNGRGLRALNCFCYTGGFSLALMAGGADEVVSVDSSAHALGLAEKNAAANGFDPARMYWVEDDVFKFLRRSRDRGERFDLVILDPPKFASSHYHVDRAARAYKDINMNGLRLLEAGGHLFTFSCSGAVDVGLFQKIVAGAVFDSGRDAWAVGRFSAGADHPLLMTCPECEYLKGLHLQVRS